MKYISTRGGIAPVTFSEAVMMGLATDGGLLLPQSVPCIDKKTFSKWRSLSYQELAFEIISLYADDIPQADLKNLINRSYSTFTNPEITPLVTVDRIKILELFHGPTLAFKDVALQLLGNFFEYLLAKSGKKLNIVGATSGDTGSAAIQGVRGKANINIFIMHPNGKTSPIQALQMTTVTDANVHNIAANGTFDDCQNIVKTLFNDLAFKEEYSLGAVNSINWARVLAQVVYYFYAWLKSSANDDEKAIFSVPTGNFGDIFAGYIAKLMGLPIDKLLLATNENNILTRFINNGDYSLGQVVSTVSPSMDIQLASNFERYLFYLYGQNPDKVRSAFEELAKDGKITFSKDEMNQVHQEFISCSVNQDETLKTIADFYRNHGYLLDPHTAVGVKAAKDLAPQGSNIICLATAHPAKFGEAVEKATGTRPELPSSLKDIDKLPTRCEIIDADLEKIRSFIKDKVQ